MHYRFWGITSRVFVRLQSFCPFSASTDHGTTFAFGINKKYFLRKKCEQKTCCVPKTIGQFSKNNKLKIFKLSTKKTRRVDKMHTKVIWECSACPKALD